MELNYAVILKHIFLALLAVFAAYMSEEDDNKLFKAIFKVVMIMSILFMFVK